MHRRSGFPTKNVLQTQRPLSSSQDAPTPQTTFSHRCRHRPDTQVKGSSQDRPGPQVSVLQDPPGNGFPTKPSGQTQVGPLFDIIHCAPEAQA